MKYILTENQYDLLIESRKKWGGKTPEQVKKEITDFVIKNNIKIRYQLQKSNDRDNGWGLGGMYGAASVLKVKDKDNNEVTLLDELFPEKSNEQKIKEITDFVIKNNIQGRSELESSEDKDNDWVRGRMYKDASEIDVLDKDNNKVKLLYKLFPKRKEKIKFKGKTPEQAEKEITDFVIKNNIKGGTELKFTSDPDNGWGFGSMYKAANPENLNILDKLFPEKSNEQKIKEITDFVIKNNIKGRTELHNSNDKDNGWPEKSMYKAASKIDVLDKDNNKVKLLMIVR